MTVWLVEVPYVPNAQTLGRIGKARAASGAAKSRIKLESFLRARREAAREIGRISGRDLFMLGLGLYIVEGTKSSVQCVFVNSDPAVINLIIRWFVTATGIKKGNLRMRLHLYPSSDVQASEAYWSKVTGLPRAQFRKPIIDWRKGKKTAKLGKLPHGTAYLSVVSLGEKRFGVFLARKILAWSGEVLNRK